MTRHKCDNCNREWESKKSMVKIKGSILDNSRTKYLFCDHTCFWAWVETTLRAFGRRGDSVTRKL